MKRILSMLAVAVLVPALVFALPGQANAATVFSLIKTTTFSAKPAAGFSTCQHKTVTLPTLGTGEYYAWGETFAGEDHGKWVRYNLKYHGKFYWTVCVFANKNGMYNYEIYSLLTQESSACEKQGKCTTYKLQQYAISVDPSAKIEWGSQIYRAPLT